MPVPVATAESGPGAAPGRSALARALSSPWFLAGVLALAAALRVAYVLSLRDLPLFDRLIVDSEHYDLWAQRILMGVPDDGRPFYMDPLYPYFLAGVYGLFGRDLLVVRLLQAALGVGTCGLVALTGRRLGGALVGNLAALLVAVYAPAIFNEGEIEKTALGVFLVTAALTCALHRGALARLGAGVALGLAVLTRGNLLVLAPVGLAWLALADRREGRRAGALAAVFALGFVAVIAPVTWRNHAVSGDWVLTTSGGGATLYTGNNPSNDTGGYHSVPFVRPSPRFEETDFRAEAERRTGRTLTASEVSSFWVRETLAHVAGRPAFATALLLKKTALFWSDYEAADGWDPYFLARFSWPLRLPLLGLAVLLPLAVVGAFAMRRDPAARLLSGYVVLYAASTIAFFIFSRYRLHVVPALAVLAAAGLAWMADEAPRMSLVRRATLAGAIAAVAAFSLLGPWLAGAEEHYGDAPDQYRNFAMLYEERADWRTAERILVEGVDRNPGGAPVLCALGDLYRQTGRPGAAVAVYGRCLRASGDTYPDAWWGLGLAQKALGQTANAARSFRVQLHLTPGHVDAERELASLPAGAP